MEPSVSVRSGLICTDTHERNIWKCEIKWKNNVFEDRGPLQFPVLQVRSCKSPLKSNNKEKRWTDWKIHSLCILREGKSLSLRLKIKQVNTRSEGLREQSLGSPNYHKVQCQHRKTWSKLIICGGSGKKLSVKSSGGTKIYEAPVPFLRYASRSSTRFR